MLNRSNGLYDTTSFGVKSMLAKLVHATRRLKYFIALIKTIKNWHIACLDYFRLLRNTEVVYVLRNGIKLKVRANIQEWAPICNIHSLKVYTRGRAEIQEGYVVIDIGAQVGAFSIFAAKAARNVKVYSYEASSANFELLRENVKMNNLENIKPFHLAVAGRSGESQLFINEKHAPSHSLSRQFENWEPVHCVTLKEIFDSNKIEGCDFLKINCEGAEYEILLNTPKEYLEKIRKVAIQCHGREFVANADPEGLRRFLEHTGFEATLAGTPSLYCYAANKTHPFSV